jgi:hypothetical protein
MASFYSARRTRVQGMHIGDGVQHAHNWISTWRRNGDFLHTYTRDVLRDRIIYMYTLHIV